MSTVKIEIEVEKRVVADALDHAWNGIRYWGSFGHAFAPYPIKAHRSDARLGVLLQIDAPLSENGYVEVEEYEPSAIHKLDLEAIKRGLLVMSVRYPYHWTNLMRDNMDGLTGDVLVQCCVFGECRYG